MNGSRPFNELKEQLGPARNLLIAFRQNPNFDQVAASLALYLSLKKAGKNVSIVSPEPMRVEFSHLIGVDQVTDNLAGGDLVITLDYPIEKIDKVSYNDDGGKLNLVVKVKSGSQPITQRQAIFSSGGGDYDLVFLVGINQPRDLGQLLGKNQELIDKRTVVSINNSLTQLGTISFVNDQASSCTEIVANIIRVLTLPVDEDIGSNLIQGLRKATHNFEDTKVNPATFEAAAFAMRMGGRRSRDLSLAQTEKRRGKKKKPRSDWFEPKIYRGTSIS